MDESILDQIGPTGRLRPIPVPGWIRTGFRLASRISPGPTARLAHRFFFTPPALRPRPEQQRILDLGQRFSVNTPVGRVAGWTWGEGEPVMLVHGWGGHAGQWTNFVEPLRERGLRAIALDLPAHGRSQGKMSSVRHFSLALESTANLFGPFAGVVAHSFGTAAATLALHRGLAVRRSVFLAPPAGFSTFFDRVQLALGLGSAARERMRGLSEAWVGLKLDEVEPRRIAPKLDHPLLVLHDRDDDEVLFEEGRELSRLWPRARFHPLSGLGHYRLLRDPRCIQTAIEFLTEERTGEALPLAR